MTGKCWFQYQSLVITLPQVSLIVLEIVALCCFRLLGLDINIVDTDKTVEKHVNLSDSECVFVTVQISKLNKNKIQLHVSLVLHISS